MMLLIKEEKQKRIPTLIRKIDVNKEDQELMDLFNSLPNPDFIEDPGVRFLTFDIFKLLINQIRGSEFYKGEIAGMKATYGIIDELLAG